MSNKNENHQTVPLSMMLKRELANEKVERPEILDGQASQSKKGEDFMLVKTECQRVVGDGVSTYSVFGCLEMFYLLCSLITVSVRERPRPSSFAAVSSSSRQLNFATMWYTTWDQMFKG